ncbi:MULTISPECIES: DUF1476 domain-containing protein [Kordiimonas]|uniref:DUF1476 domain-containing protein n=1 Tax=Kordiimonas TaxID=288021 RepID=UPI001FF1BAFE|nr:MULTISPECIES: DUF1476 domain-containing protein [Kordiimonas]MCK0069681.1 DUF1476 domain-containing protein [Kordiimonas laminariae]UTW57146.1 DUF1476 domain-containing protein [Kordiimonas sp. SCSIO 12603]
MTTFDNREKAFEDKFAHDEGIDFKVRARRNRLFGEWLATELLGLSGDAVGEYAGSVVTADLEEEGDDDVLRKVHADLEAKNVDLSDHRLEKRLEEFMAVAREQIASEA